MPNKLRLIQLIIEGKIIGESNRPSETGYVREILVELETPPDTARCICDKCGQPHDPKLIPGGAGQVSQ